MPGLDDAGVNGSDGDLEHAFAGDRPKRMEVAFHSRHLPVGIEILAQGPLALWPIVMHGDPLGIGMLPRLETEVIHHFALEPVRRRMSGGDRGKRGLAGIDWSRDAQKRLEPW